MVRLVVVDEEAFRRARPSGLAAFRFAIPAAKVLEVYPDCDCVDSKVPAAVRVYIAMDGTDRSVVMYGCSNYELVNFVCIAPESIIGRETTELWTAVGTTEDLVRVFGDFCESIRKLLGYDESCRSC